MRAHRRAALLYLAFVMTNLGVGFVLPILPVFAADIGASPFVVGAVGACQYAGMVVTSVPVSRLLGRYGSERPMIVGALALAATAALSGVAPPRHGWPVLALAQFAYGIAYNTMLLGQQLWVKVTIAKEVHGASGRRRAPPTAPYTRERRP